LVEFTGEALPDEDEFTEPQSGPGPTDTHMTCSMPDEHNPEDAMEVEVCYDIYPGQRETYSEPGCEPWLDINQVWGNGHLIEINNEIERDLEEQIWDELSNKDERDYERDYDDRERDPPNDW
jgi:hypothetical protein